MAAPLFLDTRATHLQLRVNKGEDFTVTIPVLDATNAVVSLVGWSAVAQVRASGALLYEWSAAHSNLTCTAAGVVLQFKAVETAAWAFTRGTFECDVTSPSGVRGIVARGEFAAADRVVNP